MATTLSIYPEIRRLFGALDGHKLAQIEKLNPSLDDLEITAAYLAGMDDIMGKQRLPLTGKAAKIYEIATRDEFPDEDRYSQVVTD